MDQHWEAKKKLSVRVADNRIHRLYQTAKENGALGGKITGAGGGGFLVLYTDNQHQKLRRAMQESGLRELHYHFDRQGSQRMKLPLEDRGHHEGVQERFSESSVTMLSGYRGLAEHLIAHFYKAGDSLSVLVRQPAIIPKLQELYPRALSRCWYRPLRESRQNWLKLTLEKFGRVDALINNAAIQGPAGLFHEIEFDLVTETLEIDLVAPLRLIHLTLPHLLEHRVGTVVNLSGGGATLPGLCSPPMEYRNARWSEPLSLWCWNIPKLIFIASLRVG